jgi:hypothetical protein
MRKTFYILCILSVIAIVACKKLYNPNIVANNPNYLVVEGAINNGADSTIIKLSRTTKISVNAASAPELKAVLAIEDDHNNTYPFVETGKGRYAAAPVNLNNAYNYRLRIKTADGLVYLSDYVVVKNAPPIDTLGYDVIPSGDKSGVYLYVNTHDATNNTKYYHWDFEETWRFHTQYESKYITNGISVVPRTPSQGIYYCYANDVSTSILLGSTTTLSQDVIYKQPLITIPWSSEKIELRYSILLKQYALTKEAYEFWSNIKKNTETLGSIFDAQPSAPTGNIHCISNQSIPVIGYIGAGTIQTKRIFIDKSQLPGWGTVYPYICPLDSNFVLNPYFKENQVAANLIPLTSKEIIVDYFFAHASDGYLSTSANCGDCTVRGKIAPPPFWK